VYAVGDCAEIVFDNGEHAIQQVWYTGRAQGEVVAANVLGASLRYHRGIWFNSAKFFDLEYQVYGTVPSRVEGELEHLYWEDPDARRSMRVVHRGGVVVGVNLMGIRGRHRVCERWIREERGVDHVMAGLSEMMFDPELTRRPDDAIRRHIGGMT
jgi:NADPH-dependent 2,4-dienoyl-CoA reductase/sulfur reductase-like enzyme